MSVPTSVSSALQRLTQFKHRHALVVGTGVAVLAGSLSALALAVAPLTVDPAQLPQRLVQQDVQPLAIAPQLEALAEHRLELSRTLVLRGPDSLGAIFRRTGMLDVQALSQLSALPELRNALNARSPRQVELRSTPAGRLLQLQVRQASADSAGAQTHFQRLTIQPGPTPGTWEATQETVPLSVNLRFAGGTIRSSLYVATDDAGLPDAVASQLAEIFSSDIDFHRQLRKGDTFNLVYETLTADGEPIAWGQGTGRVMAAEFRNGSKLHQAIWFDAQGDGKGEYFDATGKSRKRQFLASPLEFSRITSGFAMRMHPILRQMREHRGVDYAAPVGTAVRTVGDGAVEFAGSQSGYGNVVEVRHTKDRSTLYAHLSRIDVRVGQRVEQGVTVGAVGTTGMSTGPHLHFEFRVAGVHQDPLQIARQADPSTLDAVSRERFDTLAQTMQVKFAWAAATTAEPGTGRFE